jgi:hypothetical protein
MNLEVASGHVSRRVTRDASWPPLNHPLTFRPRPTVLVLVSEHTYRILLMKPIIFPYAAQRTTHSPHSHVFLAPIDSLRHSAESNFRRWDTNRSWFTVWISY